MGSPLIRMPAPVTLAFPATFVRTSWLFGFTQQIPVLPVPPVRRSIIDLYSFTWELLEEATQRRWYRIAP